MPTSCQQTGREQPCPCGRQSAIFFNLGEGRAALRCQQCGLLARHPLPSEEELLKFYREDYCDQYLQEQAGSGRRNLYIHALDCIERLQPPPGTLVDVGCGMGALLSLSEKRGWRAIGYDPSHAAIASARARGLEAHQAVWPPSMLPDEVVDVVTFVNVLDHLSDPFAALGEARRVLKPGGVLYIRVPNGPMHARLSRLFSVFGWQRLAVMHLFGFGRSAFVYHLPRLGFSAPTVRAALPSQSDAYRTKGDSLFSLRALLRFCYRMAHQFATYSGLRYQGWGMSLEVVARKVIGERGCD